jgi:small-conductance mechanosensitive channel
MRASLRSASVFAVATLFLGDAVAGGQPLLTPPISTTAADIIPETLAPAPSAEPAGDKRAENAKLLRLAQRKLESAGASDSAAAQQVAHYQSVEAVFAQQDVVEQQIKDLTGRKQELEEKLKSPIVPEARSGEAYPFVELDRLKDELVSEQSRATLIEDRLTSAKAALEKSLRALDDAHTKRRQAQEAFEQNKTAPNANELAAAAEQARQAATLSSELVSLRRREVAREQLAHEVQQMSVRTSREQVARLAPLVSFSEADYQGQLEQIKKKEESAHRSLANAQKYLHEANIQFRNLQQQLEAETGDRAVLAEQLEAQRWRRERRTDEIDSLTQRLGWFAQLRVAWGRRYRMAAAASDHDGTPAATLAWSELKEWQKETQAVLDELASSLRAQIFAIRTIRSSLTTITKKIDAAKDGPAEIALALNTQQTQVEAMLRIHETNLVTIETSRRVHEKLLEELGRGVLALNPKNLALGVWHQAYNIWKFEITNVGDTPISVDKIVQCLTMLIGGWVASRLFSAMFANRFLKRFRLSKDATAAVRTLAFYFLMVIVTLYTLRTFNVPLTAFTMLGGALAIGIGFGSQALVNNFIGGLIMLAERPVRLGERIIFGNFDGVVEDVGFRCTKLRTATDHLITIPNSTLVNDSIENAARRRTIRRLWNITIPADTPRDRVAAAVQAIRDVLAEKDIRERIHPIVGFEELPPRVYFSEFKSDGFNIQVLYWYAPPDNWAYMDHAERVNLRIMEEFERLGVEFVTPPKSFFLPPRETARDMAA